MQNATQNTHGEFDIFGEFKVTGQRLSDLKRQVSQPEHVNIRLASGDFLRHGPDPLGEFADPLIGQRLVGTPVRFTRIAAEQLLREDLPIYAGAKLEDWMPF